MPVHSTIQRIIQRAYHRGFGDLYLKSIEEVRSYYQHTAVPPLEVPVEDHALPSGALIRFHYPHAKPQQAPYPLIILLRANAYILDGLNATNYLCHMLAKRLKAIVAVIEPRSCPEYQFPLPFEDGISAVQYLHDNRHILHIDCNKMAIWGESSGGNYAAGITQYFAQEKIDLIGQQILFYPAVDSYRHYPSKTQYGNGYMLDTPFRDWILKQYISDPNEAQDPRVSPLLAADFKGIPPTLLLGAQYDPLRDEQAAYVQALANAHVPVQAIFYPSMIHGFLWYAAKIEEARHAYLQALSCLKSFFSAKG